MSAQWNFQLGNQHSRVYVSSPMVFACRICDKMFLSSYSLIEHYETHRGEFARRTQSNQTTPYYRNGRERNLNNNPFPFRSQPSTLQQRYHPYYRNGFRTLQYQRNLAATQRNPFLASTQNSVQPRYLVADHNTLGGVSLQFPNPRSGRTVAGSSHLLIRQRQPSPQRVSPPHQEPFPNIGGKNGYDQLAENGTVWYLSQLEKPIPKIIDLEKEDETHEYLKLDLTLQL
ncbi:hypothetical protein SOVF_121560 [Spinacia oleracea]|nr:hypothetical protein SOVF_121560 [Spinacia oleracea]